jgi:hypothetical protein
MALLQGTDIAKLLKSSGPTVKCVLLRHMRNDGKDGKPHLATHDAHKRVVLTEIIEEVEIDTTPSKNQVKKVLGGPFTFLGQYPSEGTVVMVRKELPEDFEEESIGQLREYCRDFEIDVTNMLEKQEIVEALIETQLPNNPHHLQPPLEGMVVPGDILLMRVAETEEDEDGEPKADMQVLTNEQFFLDYTKEEYIAFASRTDVTAPELPEHSSEEEEEDDDEDDDDEEEEYSLGEDDEEEEKKAILNLLMGEVLRQFREENGRGPDSVELLQLRETVAAKLGIEVPSAESLLGAPDSRKRPSDDDSSKSPKRVKWDKKIAASNTDEDEEEDKEEEKKMPAKKEEEQEESEDEKKMPATGEN